MSYLCVVEYGNTKLYHFMERDITGNHLQWYKQCHHCSYQWKEEEQQSRHCHRCFVYFCPLFWIHSIICLPLKKETMKRKNGKRVIVLVHFFYCIIVIRITQHATNTLALVLRTLSCWRTEVVYNSISLTATLCICVLTVAMKPDCQVDQLVSQEDCRTKRYCLQQQYIHI